MLDTFEKSRDGIGVQVENITTSSGEKIVPLTVKI
jgi:hypothetical protein